MRYAFEEHCVTSFLIKLVTELASCGLMFECCNSRVKSGTSLWEAISTGANPHDTNWKVKNDNSRSDSSGDDGSCNKNVFHNILLI